MASDLHIHTTFSDGKDTPEEIIAIAKEQNLKYIAITDHDTVEGLTHLYESEKFPRSGLKIITGVEMSADHPSCDIHILGYNIDIYNQALNDKLIAVAEGRWLRFSRMVDRLRELNYDITETDVMLLAGTTQSVGRAHIARVMVNKGYFTSVRDAFAELLGRGKPAYISHYKLEAEEIITLIKGAGGTPVLAHPKLIGDEDVVNKLIDMGIEGLEVYYPQHDEADFAHYLDLARQHNLLVTGGSDYHGAKVRYPEAMGVFTVPDELAEKIYERNESFNGC